MPHCPLGYGANVAARRLRFGAARAQLARCGMATAPSNGEAPTTLHCGRAVIERRRPPCRRRSPPSPPVLDYQPLSLGRWGSEQLFGASLGYGTCFDPSPCCWEGPCLWLLVRVHVRILGRSSPETPTYLSFPLWLCNRWGRRIVPAGQARAQQVTQLKKSPGGFKGTVCQWLAVGRRPQCRERGSPYDWHWRSRVCLEFLRSGRACLQATRPKQRNGVGLHSFSRLRACFLRLPMLLASLAHFRSRGAWPLLQMGHAARGLARNRGRQHEWPFLVSMLWGFAIANTSHHRQDLSFITMCFRSVVDETLDQDSAVDQIGLASLLSTVSCFNGACNSHVPGCWFRPCRP